MVLLAQQPKTARVPKPEVEVLMTRACFGRPVGWTAESLQSLEVGETYKFTEEEARHLAFVCSSGLYVATEDDPTFHKELTATPARRKVIEIEKTMRKALQKEREEEAAYQKAKRRAMIETMGP